MRSPQATARNLQFSMVFRALMLAAPDLHGKEGVIGSSPIVGLTLQSGICETRGFRSFISDTFRTHRAVRRRTVESFEEMAGFLRAYFMINRAAYRAMTVTIWEKRRWRPARIGRIVRVSMPPTAPRSGRVGGELRSPLMPEKGALR